MVLVHQDGSTVQSVGTTGSNGYFTITESTLDPSNGHPIDLTQQVRVCVNLPTEDQSTYLDFTRTPDTPLDCDYPGNQPAPVQLACDADDDHRNNPGYSGIVVKRGGGKKIYPKGDPTSTGTGSTYCYLVDPAKDYKERSNGRAEAFVEFGFVAAPTVAPTKDPTASPTKYPTAEPTPEPTHPRTPEPTPDPTATPTKKCDSSSSSSSDVQATDNGRRDDSCSESEDQGEVAGAADVGGEDAGAVESCSCPADKRGSFKCGNFVYLCPGVTKACTTLVDDYTVFYELNADECLAFQRLFDIGDPCPEICGSDIEHLERYACYAKDEYSNLADVESTVAKRDGELVCEDCAQDEQYLINESISCPRS